MMVCTYSSMALGDQKRYEFLSVSISELWSALAGNQGRSLLHARICDRHSRQTTKTALYQICFSERYFEASVPTLLRAIAAANYA